MRKQYDFTGGVRGKYAMSSFKREIEILSDTFRQLAKSTQQFREIARHWETSLKRAKGRFRYRRAYDRRAALIAKGGSRRRVNRKGRN